MVQRVNVTIVGNVADVRLDRADKLNAMDSAMFRTLIDVGDEIAQDRSVRAVVLSGEGRGFCAGLDFGAFAQMAGAADNTVTDIGWIGQVPDGAITHGAQQACWVWRAMPAPVIAAVDGVAFGAGCQLALACDLRIVAPDARLSIMESKWGLVPDMGATQTLIELVGVDQAKELAMTARVISGSEAVELGMATRVAEDPHAAAMALATELAERSPHAMQAIKRLFNGASRCSLTEGFAAERAEVNALIGSPNQVEAVMAQLEGRRPTFADPD